MLRFTRVIVLCAIAFFTGASVDRSRAAAFELPHVPSTRAMKEWLRAKVVRPKDLAQYGMHFDPGSERGPRLVVMIHGFNSTPERTAELFAAVRATGLPCATFSYPNDHALADSARLLSDELRRLRGSDPERHVSLVAYSMGGLVARACLENTTLDPGNVDQLVMIATPNHGTLLAHFTCGTDIWEHAVCGHGSPLARGRAAIADGLDEAIEDLQPGSSFLRELNAGERNGRVRYSIVLGTGAIVEQDELTLFRKVVLRTGRKIPFMKQSFQQLDRMLADMDEIVAGQGDGVVAVKRGRLAGVSDTVLVNFDHCNVTGAADNDATRRVHDEIASRLKTP